MRKFFIHYGLHASVVLICLASGVMLWTVLVVQLNTERERIIESQRHENDKLAKVFEEHVARTIRAAEIMLREIASEYLRYGMKFDLVQYAKDRAIYLDPYTVLSVIDEKGDLILANPPPPRKTLNVSKNENHQYHVRHNIPDVFISAPRLGLTSGKWTVYLTIRINKADGSFAGTSVVGMDPTYFSQIYSELNLGKDSIVTLIGRDGVVRVRERDGAVTAGANLLNAPLFTQHLPRANHGNYVGISPVDQITRIYSYRALKDYPLVVVIGTSQAVTLADYEKRRLIYIQAAGAMTAIILCFGLFALFQIAKSARASEGQRRSERLFRTLAEGSPVGIFRTDAAGKCMYVNERWSQIASMGVEAALGDGWVSAIHPEDRERVYGEWVSAANHRQPFLSEYRFQGPDGTVTWVVGQARAETDPQDNTLSYVGTVTDITDRVQGLEALQESEARFRDVAEAAGGYTWESDVDYRYTFLSERAETLFGYLPVEMLGRTPGEFMPPGELAQVNAWIAGNRLADGTVRGLEHRSVTKSGQIFWQQIAMKPMRDAAGNTTGYRGTGVDITERKHAEEARSRLAAIAESSSDAILLRNLDGKITFWNTGATRTYGYTADEMIGTDGNVAVPPELLVERNQKWEGVLRGGIVANYETTRLHKDGHRIDVSISISPVKDRDGNIIGVARISRDISERKQAEAVRTQLAAIVDASNDAIVSRDREGKILSWNRGAEMLFGYSATEMTGRHISVLTPPALRHELRIGQEEAPDFRARSHDSVRLTKDGRMIDVSISAAPIRDAAGSVSAVAIIYRDISERKQAEAVRTRLAAIVENSNDAIFSRALDGTILSWNAGAERMLGYPAAEAIGKPITFTLPPGQPPYLAQNNAALLRGEVVMRESDRMTKDGRVIPVLTSHSPIRDGAGNIVGASVILQDITALKQAEAARASLEAQLRESQKMEAIGTLAGGIAHDFNNIIATILGNTELARQDASAHPAALESLNEIRKAGVRARDLVQQILAFSRRQPTERKLTALAPVIDESVRLLRATLPARIALEAHCDANVPLVRADATLIQQALINMASNAMQSMQGKSGRIGILLDTVMLDAALVQVYPALRELHTKHPGRTVRLAVSDDGGGMDAVTLARVFEPFFTTKPAGEGTGLGLSVVHGITQMHEGAIVVESQPGKGSTFTLYLPVAEVRTGAPNPDASVAATAPALNLGGGQHIIYLDDDDALVFLVQRLLERRGYRVSAYTTQHEALAALRADAAAFDLVVTDYNMPGMSGLDVAREVRAIRAELPVAVTSGFIDETLRAQAQGAGVRELIFKADDVEVYCATIQRLAETVEKKSTSS